MGIEPFLLCSTLVGIVAQRLVRKICENCIEEYSPSPSLLTSLGITRQDIKLKRGKGCKECRETGYYGRIGIFEILPFTEKIRNSISRGVSTEELSRIAAEQGLVPLRENALRKTLSGQTTAEEMLRVVSAGGA